MRIAFQGVAGAFGEEALAQQFGTGVDRVALASFTAVFEAVATGTVGAGVVPIENSLAGSVLETYDLLLQHDVQVVGEIALPVRHCLLAPPGTNLANVTRCWSHPQALAQCAPFLAEGGIEPIAAANTAIAARDVAAAGTFGTAAIASARAGTIHGLDVVATDIQTRDDNTTRFFVIQRERTFDEPSDKASIAFATRNEPGALLACLEALAALELNLTKLESRPTGQTLWEYAFHADVETATRGALGPELIDAALEALADRTTFVRLLGRYARSNEGFTIPS